MYLFSAYKKHVAVIIVPHKFDIILFPSILENVFENFSL